MTGVTSDGQAPDTHMSELHVIERAGSPVILFHRLTMGLLVLCDEGNCVDGTAAASPPANAKRALPLAEVLDHLAGVGPEEPDKQGGVSFELDRLVVNIANDCNLRCSYCYAAGGSYGTARKLMEPDTLRKVLARMMQVFPSIRTIQLFGGEPTLNIPAIREACSFVREMQGSPGKAGGPGDQAPRLGLVSNGYSFPEPLIELLSGLSCNVTISLDGPAAVTDSLRPGEGGGRTYQRVHDNILRILRAGIRVGIECTVTARHLEMGYDVCTLMDFFDSEFGISSAHIVPVSAQPGDPLGLKEEHLQRAYVDAVDYAFDNLLGGRRLSCSMVDRVIRTLRTGIPLSEYCGAGDSTLCVDVEGRLYPCFMFVGEETMRMGDVLAGDVGGIPEVADLLARGHKDRHPLCSECWAKPLCSGCLGADFAVDRSLRTRRFCGLGRAVIEQCVYRIAMAACRLHSPPRVV